MARGDILFYASNGQFFDKVIAGFTHSRFVHVAIQYDDTTKIEMEGQGCIQSAIVEGAIAGRFIFPESAKGPVFEQGLAWLKEQVGTPYGWNDIIEALDTSHRFFWLQTGHLDCSHLAAECLLRMGYNVEGLGSDLARVTPGQLATFLHVK